MAFLESRREGDGLELTLRGEWAAANLRPILEEQAGLDLAGVRRARLLTRPAARLDLAGSWALDELTRRLTTAAVTVEFADTEPRSLQAVRHWRSLRPISVARHVYDTGITAIPIVSLIAFLISVIVAYLSASQLRNYGADIYVVDLITVGVLRELGVLLTAIIVAGRTGSAFAAEIGSMKLNEEIDALQATGVDVMETLVLPRALGLVIALPLLTMVADLIGLIGGAVLCHVLLDMPMLQFMGRANEAIASTTFWAGIVKAPVFALLIATAGTYRGMQVRGSSRELGRLTTKAVVQSIFLVLLADALFAVLFMKIDF